MDAVTKNRISIESARAQAPELEHQGNQSGMKRLGLGEIFKQIPKLEDEP
jgi:hypothetical protein